jgi:hypothetical protein
MTSARAVRSSDGSKSGKVRAKAADAASGKGRERPAPGAAAGRHTRATPGAGMAWAEQSKLLGMVLIALFAGLVHYRLFPGVSDVDSFYHLRHAWVYVTRGMFDSSFPWTQYSVVRTYAADLWYGFHVLLMPLALAHPLLDGMYLGAFLVTVASLGLAFLAFCRLRVRWPIFWVFFLALISSDLLYRLTMLRPHPLSLGLLLLLFAYLVTEPSRWSWTIVFLLAAALSWIQLTMVWLPVFVVGVVVFVRLLHRQLPEWGKLASFVAGLVLGMLLRPHPAGGFQLASVIFELLVLKQGDLPLRFGREFLPFYWINFVDQFVPLSILLLLAGAVLVALVSTGRFAAIDRASRIAIWSSLAIAAVFGVLTFTVARRSEEVFVGFSAMFFALLASHWLSAANRSPFNRVVRLIAVLTLAGALIWSIFRFDQITDRAFPPWKFQAVGEWLERNAQPREIVFDPQWDRFGELFFWDPQNYYTNGMDPFLEYAYDPSLYWKTHYYHLDAVDEYTCSAYPCSSDEQVTGTYETLKNDFHASYIVLEKDRNPKLDAFLSTAPQFEKILETDTGVVLYKIN